MLAGWAAGLDEIVPTKAGKLVFVPVGLLDSDFQGRPVPHPTPPGRTHVPVVEPRVRLFRLLRLCRQCQQAKRDRDNNQLAHDDSLLDICPVSSWYKLLPASSLGTQASVTGFLMTKYAA